MTKIEHATIDGRACTYLIGTDVAGHCEQVGNAWHLDVTVTHSAAKRLALTLPDSVTFEQLAPGYWRLSATLSGQSVTNALTAIAKLH